MKKNKGIKVFFITVLLLTVALFLAINMTGLLTHLDHPLIIGLSNNTLDWQSRPVDLVILLFFLIGGALASLRVLPNRGEEHNE